MDACLEDAASVLDRERQTLEWIRNKSATIYRLVELYNSAEEACRRFDTRAGMGVYLKWPVDLRGRRDDSSWIHVGGLMHVRDGVIDNMSHYLCVTRGEASSQRQRVLRKYHFDYASRDIRTQRRSSVFHLQYPGKLPPELKGGYDDGHLDSWLEEPRIFFMPMSLSLLLHLAFREFPNEYTNRLCEDGEWQSVHVHRDQTCLIVPFLETCVSVASDTKKKLLWDAACEPAAWHAE